VRENAQMIVQRSARDHAATVTALTEAIERRGLEVFARIDHGAGARRVGLPDLLGQLAADAAR
jgi:uncharacterized protein (DUF302 family)